MVSLRISNTPFLVYNRSTQTIPPQCRMIRIPFPRESCIFGFRTHELPKLMIPITKHRLHETIGAVPELSETAHFMASTPFAPVGPEALRDQFIDFTEEDTLMMERYKNEIDATQEEVRAMLMDNSMNLKEILSFIDLLARLGISYYYQDDVYALLDCAFEELEANSFRLEYDLCTVATQFRLFRQHGYKMPCDIFKKFTSTEGTFKQELESDINGVLSLYEAAHLRIHGEDILDEALVFSTNILQKVKETSQQVLYSLNQPLHYNIPLVATRHFISSYEKDDSRIDALLRLAKLNSNWLQLLHRRELSEIQKWWKIMGIEKKFPYVRDLSIECHFWAMSTYFEPEYSLGRIFVAKVIYIIFLIDDTYDTHGTYEEIELLTSHFERWDLNSGMQLPVAYMQSFLEFIINTFNEFSDEMTRRGKPYVATFAKDRIINYLRSQCVEAKWSHERIRPTFEEFMTNAKRTSAVDVTVISSCMEENMAANMYEKLLQSHKAICAAEVILRLKNDIISHKDEQVRGDNVSVDCYMKDFDMTKQEVVNVFHKMIDDAWKDLNEALLVKMNDIGPDVIPRSVLERIINCARQAHTLYSVVDKPTSARLKHDIIAAYTRSFCIE